jgi:hypothetical protein
MRPKSLPRSRLKPLLQPLLKEGEDATALLSRFPFSSLSFRLFARILIPVPFPRHHHFLVFYFTYFRRSSLFYSLFCSLVSSRLTSFLVHVTPVTCTIPNSPLTCLLDQRITSRPVCHDCVCAAQGKPYHLSPACPSMPLHLYCYAIICTHFVPCLLDPCVTTVCALPKLLTHRFRSNVSFSTRSSYNHIRVHSSYSGFGSVSDLPRSTTPSSVPSHFRHAERSSVSASVSDFGATAGAHERVATSPRS